MRRAAASTCAGTVRSCRSTPGSSASCPSTSSSRTSARRSTAGAQHISFGDPDFLNGPTHARRVLERFAARVPGPHLRRHHQDRAPAEASRPAADVARHRVPVHHERRGVGGRRGAWQVAEGAHARRLPRRRPPLCRAAGVTLVPTFVPFTPWTTLEGYVELLEVIEALDLVEHVAPIQLAIRLLVTARSALLELPDIRAAIGPFDARVADLSVAPPRRARGRAAGDDHGARRACARRKRRRETFAAIAALAREQAGLPPRAFRRVAAQSDRAGAHRCTRTVRPAAREPERRERA